jgi:hypothetical protein
MAFLDFRLPDIDLSAFLKPSQWLRQADALPDAVRQRHVGEGIRYIRSGLTADRPAKQTIDGSAFFSTDDSILSIWNGTSWVELNFS